MTRQEFEQRTGCQLTPEAYEPIERIYMAAGEMDKDLFCEEWKQHGDSPLVAALMDTIGRRERKTILDQKTIKRLQHELDHTCDLLICAAEDNADDCLRSRVRELFGARDVILAMVDNGYKLLDEDREYLHQYLA